LQIVKSWRRRQQEEIRQGSQGSGQLEQINLHHFVSYIQGIDARVFKIKTENNIVAHKHSQEAYQMSNLDNMLTQLLEVMA
jgi:hypothetical protein